MAACPKQVGTASNASPVPDSTPTSPPQKDRDEEGASEHEEWWKLYVSQLGLKVEPPVRDPRDKGTADAWIGRNPSLIRLTGKHPLNCEPPLALLMHHGFITPAPLHYVRNHGSVPRGDWSTWTVKVTGLVKQTLEFTMDQLVDDFRAVNVPATLVCAGNRRKEQNMVRQTRGFNWGAAGVSTSVWRGARLCDVLLRCGILEGALHVCFEGADHLTGPGAGDGYGISVTREWALDKSRDIILAYKQNGKRLLPDHGFPVRVIIPVFIGGRMVKWVTRIVVSASESNNYYHFRDNRVLPSHVDTELADAQEWWYKPEYIINELNTNSVITTPGHDEELPIIHDLTTQPAYTIKGYAYAGGGKKITRVEVTLDGGETWMVCTLDVQENPNEFGRYWCWCFWSVKVEVLDLVRAKEVAVRAWDQAHNTQPEKLIWNLMGMMNNCWFKVKVNVRPHKRGIRLVFQHPTQPGNQTGGWMAPVSTPLLVNTIDDKQMQFTMAEVEKHKSKEHGVWIVVHGHVYDVTTYLKDHPGGPDIILMNAGKDCTMEFDRSHSNSDRAKELLGEHLIGRLITTGGNNHEATASAKPIAQSGPRELGPCRLVGKEKLSSDVRRFRFALPSPKQNQVLGLPVGKHIDVCANIEGTPWVRAYTPTSRVDEIGHFELLVKVYLKNKEFPSGGLMTQYLESLPVGTSYVDVTGPHGHVEYTGRGKFKIRGEERQASHLAMICGRSGITPMYQVIQAVVGDQPEDKTVMLLVYANKTAEDILLRDELDDWADKYQDRLKVWYVIEKEEGTRDASNTEGGEANELKFSVGRVTEEILGAHMPKGGENTLALACGPPPMINSIKPMLKKMGYDKSFISF